MFILLTDFEDKKVIIPLNANPSFEGVTENHGQYGTLVKEGGINTVVRLNHGDSVYTFKVKETPIQIRDIINKGQKQNTATPTI